MISRSLLITGVIGVVVFSFVVVSTAAEPKKTNPFLRQGEYLLKKGQWDLAQSKFQKVLTSNQVEERIYAYEGLLQLYQTLHMPVKAGRIQKKLDQEKEFRWKLVPKWDSYYREYTIKEGDDYGKLASRDKISLEWLVRANEKTNLRKGDIIRLPKIHYSLVVEKEKKTLTWKRGTEVIKIYPIAIGAQGMETPTGDLVVTNKVEKPVWYTMGQEYPNDSPKNLLGTRWLGLSQKGYGIHGTRNPNSIGKAASHGCIRMYNHDVEELFRWVPVGTKVIIR